MLNVDETSVKLHPPVRKGWVVAADSRERKALLRTGDGSSLASRRSAVSLVSFLADSVEIQKLLPHVFLSNKRILTQADARELNAVAASNVLFARRKSGWVNSATMIEILRLLARCLSTVLATHRVVLCLDTYRAHSHVSVVKECTRLGFFFFLIPASLTGWLQPLDVAVFKPYKDWVARELERMRLAAAAGVKPSTVQVLAAYAAGIPAVLESQAWGKAFDLAGLRGQSRISNALLQRLGCEAPVVVPATLPTAADLQAVYPRRSNIPVDDLFELVVRATMPPRPILLLPKRARLTVKTRPEFVGATP
jgi:hypothetical protein